MVVVSVIVPVYNVEKFISRCIESVLKQEMPYWELILVDDGSKDSSGDICEQYAAGDNRIRVFHKENGGVSSARNYGLSKTRGEWVFFLDSDDAIETNFLNVCSSSPSVSVIIKPIITILNDKVVATSKVKDSLALSEKDDIYKYYVNNRLNGLCDKIIRRSIIGDKRLDESVKVGEDFLFFLSFIDKVKSISFSGEGRYIYYKREGSAITSLTPSDHMRIILENIFHVQRITKESNNVILGDNIIAFTYFPLICQYFRVIDSDQKRELGNALNIFNSKDLKYLKIFSKIKVYIMKYIFFLIIKNK